MGTTVIKTSLTVTISESISLNGVEYGNNISKTFDGNGKVDQRIMGIAGKGGSGTDFTTILALSTVDARGQVVVSKYTYFRITNLDDTNNFYLEVKNAAAFTYFNIEPGESLLLMSPDMDSHAASGSVTLADISEINGQSSSETDAIDIEYVVITEGGIS